MTVEQYLKHQLAVNEEKVADTADDATDALMSTFKTHKEELRDDQHARKLATAVPTKGKVAGALQIILRTFCRLSLMPLQVI